MTNTFANAVTNQEARTLNGMKARQSTADSCVDFYYQSGGMRGKDITALFTAALVKNADLAIRIALNLRDIRGGKGERQLFRDILKILDVNYPELLLRVLPKIPEIGRWDDIFSIDVHKNAAYDMLKKAIIEKNGLACKWSPRKGDLSVDIRSYFGWSPKHYRKMLVEGTKVVEQQMCANKWDDINFSHVPSVASRLYSKAFGRHTEEYSKYIEKLTSGDTSVKVNAGAIYPHIVLGELISNMSNSISKTTLDFITAQWNALPNYTNGSNILAMIDTSDSMSSKAGNNSNVRCRDVAYSLGMYIADKNVGKFNGTFLTFSRNPTLQYLKGNILEKLRQVDKSQWDSNTDLGKAFDLVLNVAKKGKVPQSEMPEMFLILSDMQFDECIEFDDTALEMITRMYEDAGYTMPNIVFWNISSHGNAPASFNEEGVALVSGFSTNVLETLLSDVKSFNPYDVMMKVVMNPRYDF